MAFQCEQGHLVEHPSDRIVVSLDFVTADGKTRMRRIQVRKMCKKHASEWIDRMDLRPRADQLGFVW